MKKILASVLALILILSCVSAFAEGELVELYKSDFTKADMDGWVANNARGTVDEEGNFVISGRAGLDGPHQAVPAEGRRRIQGHR